MKQRKDARICVLYSIHTYGKRGERELMKHIGESPKLKLLESGSIVRANSRTSKLTLKDKSRMT